MIASREDFSGTPPPVGRFFAGSLPSTPANSVSDGARSSSRRSSDADSARSGGAENCHALGAETMAFPVPGQSLWPGRYSAFSRQATVGIQVGARSLCHVWAPLFLITPSSFLRGASLKGAGGLTERPGPTGADGGDSRCDVPISLSSRRGKRVAGKVGQLAPARWVKC